MIQRAALGGTSSEKVRSLLLTASTIAMFCTCFGVLYIQSTYIQSLHNELTSLKGQVGTWIINDEACKTDAYCDATAYCGLMGCTAPCRKQGDGANRGRREVTARMKKRQRRQTESRTLLHLVPVSSQSYEENDRTVLTWALLRNQGEGLKVSGHEITVVTGGTYFIYSQVFYKDKTWVMGHVITKRLRGGEMKLLSCVKNMPDNASLARNTCYTAGVHFLEEGSVMDVSIPRKSAKVSLSAHSTYLGIFSI